MSLPKCRYLPLEPGQRDIRLFLLQTGRYSPWIEVTLGNASLEDDEFIHESPSYAWGDPSAEYPIILDGNSFESTKNIGHAIQQIRREDIKRLLWIDVICIIKREIAEKNEQVRQMRDVYRGASRTLAWMGSEADNSDVALSMIE